MLAADVQQFYCFEVLSEILARLTTPANIFGSAQAQLAKRAPRFNHRIIVVFLGWFRSFQ